MFTTKFHFPFVTPSKKCYVKNKMTYEEEQEMMSMLRMIVTLLTRFLEEMSADEEVE